MPSVPFEPWLRFSGRLGLLDGVGIAFDCPDAVHEGNLRVSMSVVSGLSVGPDCSLPRYSPESDQSGDDSRSYGVKVCSIGCNAKNGRVFRFGFGVDWSRFAARNAEADGRQSVKKTGAFAKCLTSNERVDPET